jgi:ribosomal protein S4
MKKIIERNQHGLKWIRRFDEDIWGTLANKELKVISKKRRKYGRSFIITKKYLKNGKHILNYIYEVYQNTFIYKKLLRNNKRRFFLLRRKQKFAYKIVTHEKEFKRKKRRLKTKYYLNLLKIRRFYGNLSKKEFKKVFKESNLISSFLGKSFICLLETRLDVILYRCNFFNSIFAARKYILHKGLYVNGLLFKKPNYKLKLNNFIFLQTPDLFYNKIKKKLKNKKIFGTYPKYLEVNYKLGAITLIKIPKVTEVPFPFFVNFKHIGYSFIK